MWTQASDIGNFLGSPMLPRVDVFLLRLKRNLGPPKIVLGPGIS